MTWYDSELTFTAGAHFLRKDWTLYDAEGAEILSVHAHSMIGKHKVSVEVAQVPDGIAHPHGLELYCAWLATRFSLERIRLAGA